MKHTGTAIEVRDLYFSYDGISVLKNARFVIHPLDRVCIVGPNGGGKTTLVKLIMGLLRPESGSIRIFGQQPEIARQRIGYVPQYVSYDPHFPISVREVVVMGRLGRTVTGHYTRDDYTQVDTALADVGITSLARRSFASLSGGQRQRVLIARALATGGDILILDEPTANIDRQSEERLFDLLTSLNRHMTILMVTHEVGFASTFFERFICVNNEVHIHPTSALTGELIQNMYGGDLQMIRHDHRCSAQGHEHD